MKKILLSFLFLLISTPFVADSAEIITNANVDLGPDNIYYENLYVGAGRSNISSTVDSDLTIISGESKVTGRVTGDVFVGGGVVNFSGQTDGDLRVIGGEVSVSGIVTGDLLVIGGEVYVSKDATLLSDILLIGGKINFEGNSPKRLKVVAGKIYVNSQLNGNSEITTQNLSIGPDSVIDGDFSYYSPQKFSENSGAQIIGNVSYNKINSIQDTGVIKKTVVNFLNFWLLLGFITTLIIAFILVYVFRVFSVEVNKIVTNSFWKSLLAGFLAAFLLPIVIIMLIVSLFAMPVGFLLLLSFIFLLIIAPAISGIFLGTWIRKKIAKDKEVAVDFHSVTIGVILYTLLQFVPVVGGLFRFILVLAAFGATIRYLRIVIFK